MSVNRSSSAPPRLALTGELGLSSHALRGVVDPENSVWNLGANLIAPLLDGGQRRIDAEIAESRQREGLSSYVDSAIRGFREVEDALSAEASLTRQQGRLELAAAELVKARDAAIKAMRQVTGPVVATTRVLIAVFVPVAFLGGLTGQLYRQFAITIAASVFISSLVALTLSPAMCRLLIKPRPPKKLAPFRAFDWCLDRATGGYAGMVRVTLRAWIVGVPAFGACGYAGWWLYNRVPTGFIPNEDQGVFLVSVQLPDGASLERNDAMTRDVEAFLLQQPEVANVVVLGGQNIMAGNAAQTNATAIFVTLKTWSERTTRVQGVDALLGRLWARFADEPRGLVIAFNPPAVPGLGQRAGFELQLQARGGADIAELNRVSADFSRTLGQRPEATGVSRTLSVGQPLIYVDLDEEQAKVQGVAIDEVFGTLRALFGSLYVKELLGSAAPKKSQASHCVNSEWRKNRSKR